MPQSWSTPLRTEFSRRHRGCDCEFATCRCSSLCHGELAKIWLGFGCNASTTSISCCIGNCRPCGRIFVLLGLGPDAASHRLLQSKSGAWTDAPGRRVPGTGWAELPYSSLSIKPRNWVIWGGHGCQRRLYGQQENTGKPRVSH